MTVSQHIGLQTKISYGLGAFGKDLACSIIYTYLMFYYTDVAGLSAAFVGTLFLVARVIDAVTDPMMGMLVDNTRTRFGKFRPWIMIGTLINGAVLIAVFSTHLLSGTTLYVYAAITYILWGVTYTIMDIPFWSMIPALSSERQERDKLVVWPKIFASFAWMLMGAYGLWAIGVFGGDNQGRGFVIFAIAIVICFIASSMITFFFVKEKVGAKSNDTRFTIKDVMHILASNDQLKAFIGVILTFNIAHQLVGGFAIYYFTYAVGNADLFPLFMLVSGLSEMIGVFLFPHLCRIIPRNNMWPIACGFPALCCLILFVALFIAPQNTLLVGAAGIALKFGVGLANGLGTVMLADVVDYGEVKTGHRSESIIFSAQAMLVKFAGAISGFFIGLGLTIVGYVPNQIQSAETIIGMNVMMLLIPVLFVAVSLLLYLLFYRLNGHLYYQLLGKPVPDS